jgi:hypothetical protein
MAIRHFPYRHPTFGTATRPKTSSYWKVSVYFWWFEYLRRNIEYQATCRRNGKGKHSKLYEHFGDVMSGDFRTWWSESDRGANLFAEPQRPSIRVRPPSESDQRGIQLENIMLIEVPLDLPIGHLVRNFRQILSKHHSGRKGGRQALSSQAMFKPTGKVDVAFLQIALLVWDSKKSEPQKPLWRIAQDLGISRQHHLKSTDSPSEMADKKNTLAATASRYFRKADAMIQRVVLGQFPH